MKQINLHLLKSFTIIISAIVLIVGCKKPPKVSFRHEIQNGGLVQFTNTTAGNIDELVWNFGDNEISTETNPLHRYLKAGTFRVTLTVENSDGKDTYAETITILEGNRENLEDHPQFNNADGYFYARNILEFEKTTPTLIKNKRGKAIAALYDSTNFLVNVGRVSVNGIQLTNNADNSYSYRSPDSSFHFTDEVRWVADGGNGYPPIVEDIPKSFPDLLGITSIDTFNHIYDSTYTLKTAKQILYADSIIWLIENSDGIKIAEKRTGGGLAGVLFEKEDLSKLVDPNLTGTFRTKVIAYSFIRKNHDFKTVYYTKESFTESQFRAYSKF